MSEIDDNVHSDNNDIFSDDDEPKVIDTRERLQQTKVDSVLDSLSVTEVTPPVEKPRSSTNTKGTNKKEEREKETPKQFKERKLQNESWMADPELRKSVTRLVNMDALRISAKWDVVGNTKFVTLTMSTPSYRLRDGTVGAMEWQKVSLENEFTKRNMQVAITVASISTFLLDKNNEDFQLKEKEFPPLKPSKTKKMKPLPKEPVEDEPTLSRKKRKNMEWFEKTPAWSELLKAKADSEGWGVYTHRYNDDGEKGLIIKIDRGTTGFHIKIKHTPDRVNVLSDFLKPVIRTIHSTSASLPEQGSLAEDEVKEIISDIDALNDAVAAITTHSDGDDRAVRRVHGMKLPKPIYDSTGDTQLTYSMIQEKMAKGEIDFVEADELDRKLSDSSVSSSNDSSGDEPHS
jgi:hypothetical protein